MKSSYKGRDDESSPTKVKNELNDVGSDVGRVTVNRTTVLVCLSRYRQTERVVHICVCAFTRVNFRKIPKVPEIPFLIRRYRTNWGMSEKNRSKLRGLAL